MRFFIIFIGVFLFASQKTPSDVYSYAIILKKKVEYLRKKAGINKPFPYVPPQHNKYPRHVLQKALEILNKINLYRIIKGYGPIFIPPYPTRDITPNDVYEMVKRDDAEVTSFINDLNFLLNLKYKKYTGKTPNDVYRLLWSISLGFNDLLGIHGYTPNDVYALSIKLLKNVKFIRESQNLYNYPKLPKKQTNVHANHLLYKSFDFLKKLKKAQEHLWITHPTDIPKKPHHVITMTEVYDSLQYDLAELQRLKYRLGIERYFKEEPIKENKTPADILQILEYSKELLPIFKPNKPLIQYPISSLNKTPNDVYAVTEEILRKINILKNLKGIHKKANTPPYIYGLKPIHVYQKALESTEKALKLKVQMGFYPSKILGESIRKITPNEVYEKVIRLDGIITILLKKAGYKKAKEYIYKIDKKIPNNKTPSDVYFNLWKISNNLDLLLIKGYSYNQIFKLEKRLEAKIVILLRILHIKESKIDKVLKEKIETNNIYLQDIFKESINLFNLIKKVQKRMNMNITNIIIPEAKNITTNNIYNILRIINASLNEILIYKDIDDSLIPKSVYLINYKNKTINDIYKELIKIQKLIKLLYKEENYED